MNTKELITEVRSRLCDSVGTSGTTAWSDADLLSYANAARDRLFILVRRLVIDASTGTDADGLPLCTLPLVAGVSTYALSPKILSITRLKLDSQARPLEASTLEELDSGYDWQQLSDGEPWTYCTEIENDKITFVPAPLADDIARLNVMRLPLVRLSGTLPLEFREEYHEDLIPWMLYLSFRKKDSETYNPGLAEEYRKTFLDRASEIKLEMKRSTTTLRNNRAQRAFGAR